MSEAGTVQEDRKNLAKPGAVGYDRGQRSDADEAADAICEVGSDGVSHRLRRPRLLRHR